MRSHGIVKSESGHGQRRTRHRSRKLPPDIQAVALRKLRFLNQTRVPGDLRVRPVWDDGGPRDVEIIDYHG
jgi:proteic killer suppression protein